MENLYGQLRDIRGLDPISWWPPAPGWWLLAAGILITLALIAVYLRLRRDYPLGRWQRDAKRRLVRLKRRIPLNTPHESAAELSELLRRIAVARCGRAHCAGLTGEVWLAWLEANDPNGFQWREEGGLLLDLPYAPPDRHADQARVIHLTEAAIRWVSAADKVPCRV
ncbi:MAG TPA: DUF4381 domain-containing protein [Chromatiales bacterium]|nr:DUF4381 domain-containing protein [Chromatiales bacterium]